MLVQFIGQRNFHISRKNIIKSIRGTSPFIDNPSIKDMQVFPGAIVDLEDSFGKKLVKEYPRDCMAYGLEALKQSEKDKKSNKGKKTDEGDPNALDGSNLS